MTTGQSHLSSFTGPEPVQEIQRWDKATKTYIDVERPYIVATYNKYMGGLTFAMYRGMEEGHIKPHSHMWGGAAVSPDRLRDISTEAGQPTGSLFLLSLQYLRTVDIGPSPMSVDRRMTVLLSFHLTASIPSSLPVYSELARVWPDPLDCLGKFLGDLSHSCFLAITS
ncbi:unnamed protein product [Menidia menidia]|uniref:(Atlantic silverside) hypothetical protein n=1 Tax=Menidia menidia TaxID=238744 RepID=A0A8S4BHC7_9TELE|nr:unnamed protein product [Menidia menidia]